ncbi:MAG TPA: ADOP family duplicated permease [Vicinamibacterales bacterium]|nr:ADOP family duplicated permease [Vicinamibacterales bacterium]
MLSRLVSLWRNLRHRDRVEGHLDDELIATLDLLIDEKIAAGVEPLEARRCAMIELNRIEPIKERVRDIRAGMLIDTLIQDVKYALRHMRRAPGFAAAAILTLAFGIGANTAMFTMLNAIVLRRLPIADADNLLAIVPINSRGTNRTTPMSAVVELRDGPLDHFCAYLGGLVLPVLANDAPLQTSTTFVTSECFNAFGIAPILGRGLSEADAPILGPGANVAVISHRLWTTTYNSDPSVLGHSMLVNNVPVTIVGVLPRGFVGLEIDTGVDIFTPFDAVLPAGRGRRQLASYLLGRLRPGVTIEAATAEIEARWPAMLEAVLPANMAPTERAQLMDSKPRLMSLGTGISRLRERYSQPLMLILGLTGLLLILACINLGGLLLSRLNARSAELALRLAIGGSRWRIAQQMLVENGLLSLAGALLAMPVAYATAVTLASFMPPINVPYTISFMPDARVFVLTTAVAITVGILMSALPVWFATQRRRAATIRWDRTIVGATGWWGRMLLVAQVSLAIVMLVNASLLAHSLYLLNTGDLGIRPDNLLTVKTWSLPRGTVYGRADRDSYYPPLVERVRALPGVTAVALASSAPRSTTTSVGSPVAWKGDAYDNLTANGFDSISPAYFDTMGIRLLAGRDVSWQDTMKTIPVAVVSESLARTLQPEGHVVGRTFTMRTLPTDLEFQIVGVVSDATHGDPRNSHTRAIYRPILQVGPGSSLNPNVIIQTTDPRTAAGAVRQILSEFGRDYAQEIISVNDLLARAPSTERMSATVAGAVSGIAVLLALIGVHGALAYSVARRTREIGVRLAVGAAPVTAARAVMLEGLLVCLLGVATGLPLAAVSARSLRALMFGISANDPATYGAAAAIFLVLGVAAGVAPARRAASVDPVIALRAE